MLSMTNTIVVSTSNPSIVRISLQFKSLKRVCLCLAKCTVMNGGFLDVDLQGIIDLCMAFYRGPPPQVWDSSTCPPIFVAMCNKNVCIGAK